MCLIRSPWLAASLLLASALSSLAQTTSDEAEAIAEIQRMGGTVTVGEEPGKETISVEFGYRRQGWSMCDDLALFRPRFTDAVLVNLRQLPRLESLNLADTDAGLESLRGLRELRELRLRDMQVTDAGLRHLQGLTNLTSLDLSHTQVTDDGLQYLKALGELRELHLRKAPVMDAGLEHLRGLANLRLLDLSDTQVTDAGLAHLRGLHDLRMLDLRRTAVTREGVTALHHALPNCGIDWKASASGKE